MRTPSAPRKWRTCPSAFSTPGVELMTISCGSWHWPILSISSEKGRGHNGLACSQTGTSLDAGAPQGLMACEAEWEAIARKEIEGYQQEHSFSSPKAVEMVQDETKHPANIMSADELAKLYPSKSNRIKPLNGRWRRNKPKKASFAPAIKKESALRTLEKFTCGSGQYCSGTYASLRDWLDTSGASDIMHDARQLKTFVLSADAVANSDDIFEAGSNHEGPPFPILYGRRLRTGSEVGSADSL
ncbi:hypothetical protein K458DRAFT_408861 [Lentithecium fluviatile CBS 122367]|uniref:Uncharacterized protein n=1 Tax=Lentithecium fluviatile CBS 122367 TaxID=1168545 RepID=A0A6G1IK38_9PLEO|nr:hypothetical protein K458DRAFT_408861 [Lentithecium fluviatile CBS 122367]